MIKKKIQKKIWEKVKTIIVVGLNYAPEDNPLKTNNFKEKANISVYAKNKDYHVIIKNKLKEFKDWFDREFKLDCKIFVDTAPVMEKYFAKETGVGVVCSGHEAKIVREIIGQNLLIFTPGIRMTEDGKNDQKRVCTPAESIKNGANKIIMGRSLIKGNIEENVDKVSNSIKE